MTETTIETYCQNCEKEIQLKDLVCPYCASDLKLENSRLVKIKIIEEIEISDSLRLKAKTKNGKRLIEHRVEIGGKQHRIERKRKENERTEVYHKVWDKNLNLIHYDKK